MTESSKPQNLLQQLPCELGNSTRWVNYRLVTRGDRTEKVPVDHCGAPINAQDHANWISFEEAQRRDSHRLGLVIAHPFIGVDLDKCFRDGHLTPDFQKLFDLLPRTYAEVSPSGKGLHLWYACDDHAKLPDSAVGAFEVYARKRYFTMTGERFGQSPLVVTRLSLDQAMAIFQLAAPQAATEINLHDDEPGYWDQDALAALLKAWTENIVDFRAAPGGSRWEIPCPGNEEGWADGNCHSSKDPKLSRNAIVWIRNGWPVFNCFHAHCAAKTWNDLRQHYDPLRLFFEFDSWVEAELRRLEVPCQK